MFGMFGGGYYPGGAGGGRFEASYRCYPVSFIDKPEAERGDKLFLPPSALDRLGAPAAPGPPACLFVSLLRPACRRSGGLLRRVHGCWCCRWWCCCLVGSHRSVQAAARRRPPPPATSAATD